MSLLVFSDDWGRHPSSCQHLVGRLLPEMPAVWVNTIGMRRPRFEWYTVTRGLEKMVQWLGPRPAAASMPANLQVVNPVVWPGFGSRLERSLNRRLMERQLRSVVAGLPRPRVAVTTIPTVADLVGRLSVDRWVYYCVDDFTVWPGLDQRAVARLETRLIERADEVVVVSETLQARFARPTTLLTHGVDLDFWRSSERPAGWTFPRPWLLFWGLFDRRMDTDTLRALDRADVGTAILVGPEDNPDPAVKSLARVKSQPAVPVTDLPALAAAADVLILPYADLPVTRAIQPLKLKEYLATGKPVVAADLPAVREWADCLDAASSPDAFVAAIRRRLAEPMPATQHQARKRLEYESWDEKARQFRKVLFGTQAASG